MSDTFASTGEMSSTEKEKKRTRTRRRISERFHRKWRCLSLIVSCCIDKGLLYYNVLLYSTMTKLSQLILGDTGCASYIIFCEKRNKAAIVDSFLGFEENIEKELMKLSSPTVEYVIDTHNHADRRSSSPLFSKKHNTGGIVKSSKTPYKGQIKPTEDGDIILVGEVQVEVMFTPGHTPDHNCYLVDNEYLLTGDCLFIGDVGRIDLGGDYRKKSDLMFDSLRRLEKLDPNLRIYPNHVGAVHAISSEATYSQLGHEIETNEAMQIKDKDEFFTYMTEGWPPKPDDWEQIIQDNLNG